jgi:hypothetical protein
MKRIDSTKLKYTILSKSTTILTNFLNKRQMDFTFEIIGEQLPNPANHGWEKDF